MEDKRATILYIEDDPGSQRLVQRALAFEGYDVVVASRGLEGIDRALEVKPDLILMDINLPDLSGREVTTRLRALTAFDAVPIVALTAQSHAEERDKTLVAGATGYLTKPVDIDLLPKQVAGFLGGKREHVTADMMQQASQAYNRELVERLESKIRELEQANADLRQLDQSKEKFIQLTAHELRTPLTVIQGYAQLLRDMGAVERIADDHPDVASLIQTLSQSVERMATVINEIVMVSRITTGRIDLSLGPVTMEEIIEKAVAPFEAAAEQRAITIRRPPGAWQTRLRADGGLLVQSFNGLISNAIKYTPDGGLVTVVVEEQSEAMLVRVQDSGIGIDPQEQERLFEPFYTAGDTQLHSTSKTAFLGGGLGVGLAIAKAVITEHHGKIWVESTGRDESALPGSTFYIQLPKTQA